MATSNEAVLKYELRHLRLPTPNALLLPVGAQILHVGVQRGRVFAWARVNTDETQTEARLFRALYTGEHVLRTGTLRFVTTLLLEGGDLVLHVFEEIPDA